MRYVNYRPLKAGDSFLRLKLFILILLLSACSHFPQHTKVDAKVENVLFSDSKSDTFLLYLSPNEITELKVGRDFSYIITDKGVFFCGKCLDIIECQKHYWFYLKGKEIQKMEKIHPR